MIVDTHQHLWDLTEFDLPWLADAPEVLRRSYTPTDYRAATDGLGFEQSVYMEVDVADADRQREAEYVLDLCDDAAQPTVGAVVAARPGADGFADEVRQLAKSPGVKGIRRVLHVDETPPGHCQGEAFVADVRLLGELGLSFDVCIRPRELPDAVALAAACPETTIIIDHCGNADPKAFNPRDNDTEPPWHDADEWRRDMAALASLDNTVCKISGIIARARADWSAEDLSPIVDHCLDAFGPDRVVFGSDWPVCLLVTTLAEWVGALREIVASRDENNQRKLWSENARRIYRL